jgi:hypothetical protein
MASTVARFAPLAISIHGRPTSLIEPGVTIIIVAFEVPSWKGHHHRKSNQRGARRWKKATGKRKSHKLCQNHHRHQERTD